jgi:hypothetical protein
MFYTYCDTTFQISNISSIGVRPSHTQLTRNDQQVTGHAHCFQTSVLTRTSEGTKRHKNQWIK